MTRATAIRLGQLAITALLIGLLWSAIDGPQTLSILAQAQIRWLLAAVGVLICQTILSALRWKLIAGALGHSLRVPHAIKEYFLAQVANQALPGAVVGDAARAVRARAGAGLGVAVKGVVFERLAGQIAMFLTMACAFVVTFLSAGGLDWPPQYAATLGTAIAVGATVTCAIALSPLYRKTSDRPVSNWMRQFHTAVLSKNALPTQIALGVAITTCNLGAFGLCGWAVGVHLSVSAVLAIVPVILFSMLIPLTVSGWGIREGAAAALLPLAGTSTSEAVATSILFGVAMLVATLPGLIVLVLK